MQLLEKERLAIQIKSYGGLWLNEIEIEENLQKIVKELLLLLLLILYLTLT